MKTIQSEDYYKAHWNEYMKPVPGNHYMNLENDLNQQIETYEAAMIAIPEEQRKKALEVIKRQKATMIATETCARLKETMAMIKNIKAGKASLGYTTWNQERAALRDLVLRFEFNCLQLREFKIKYGVK